MATDWIDIRKRLGDRDVDPFVREEIVPRLSAHSRTPENKADLIKALRWPMAQAMLLFLISFALSNVILPDNAIGNLLGFVLFPILFFACIGGMLWVHQGRFVGLLAAGETHFLARADALHHIAQWLGMAYVPAPGGAPETLRRFANSRLAHRKFKEITALLDQHGGMDRAIGVARASGVLSPNVLFIGDQAQKGKALQQAAQSQNLQDGFYGVRNGISFDAFEWVEPVPDDAPLHHLVLVLDMPVQVNSTTQLRSKDMPWPEIHNAPHFAEVDLGVRVFTDRFDLRSTDQTEARAIFNPAVMERLIAFAHDDAVRATAFANHLVVGMRGHNRFDLINLITGEWNEDSIKATFNDFADLLACIDVIAHTFMVQPKRPPIPGQP